MRFLLLLLPLFCFVSPAFNATGFPYGKLISTMKTSSNVTIIHDPAIPFARFGVVYYWSGYYKRVPGNPKKCIFLRNHPDWPFGEHLLSNGTKVHGVEFGCTNDDICRKYRCDKSIASGLVWCAFLLISSIISVGIVIRYVVGRRKEEDRHDDETEMRSYVPVVVVNRVPNGHLQVPQLYPMSS